MIIIWVDVYKLKSLLLYPLEIRSWVLEDIATNFSSTPREAKLETKNLRKV